MVSDTPVSLVVSGASAGSAFSVVAPADAGALPPAACADSESSKSSRFITGAGAGSGAFPAALDCIVDERLWLVAVVALGAVVRRGEVS